MTDMVPLGDVVKIRYGYSFPASDFSDTGIPVIRMSDLQNYVVDTSNAARVPEHYWDKLEGYRILKGDLIIGMSGSVGKLGIYNDDKPALQNQRVGVFIVKSPKDIDKDYLKYFAFTLESKLLEISKGVAVKNVSAEEIESLKLPLSPLTEQKRIASLLRRADRLRQLRRTAHDLSDALLQSVFLEMFGEALNGKNPKIPLVPLETLCTKITDGTHVTPTYLHEGVPFLSVKNITRFPGRLDFSDIKYISPEEHKKISKLSNVERDDILYTKVGATYGYAQIVDTDREFSIFVSVALLKPDKTKILPKYFECVMKTRFVKEQADRLVSGIGVPDLHLREIKTFQIPLPPLSLQEEFAGVVARVESLRGRMSEAGRQVEGLFDALLSQSFGD